MSNQIAGLTKLLRQRRANAKGPRIPAIRILLLTLIVLLVAGFVWLRWFDAKSPIFCTQPVASSSSSANPVKPALGAYELWLALGNSGTEQDFLNSLIGKPGKNGYTGSNGSGGSNGKSAYQLWLDAGNKGSSEDFLKSLDGSAGSNGLSAYELWIAEGNKGTTEDFFNSLAGVPGSNGVNGANGSNGKNGKAGASAYDIWLANGNTGTESDFLKSLVGQDGVDGAPGICSIGPSGASGSPGEPGLSAYEVWKKNGGVGSEKVFLASLIGPTGEPGPTGATGEAGPSGIAGFGDSGSFWDDTAQGGDGLVSTSISTAYPIYFSDGDTANNQGIHIVRCEGDEARPDGYPALPKSCIKFSKAGVYNIAFSAQLYRTAGGNADVYSFWLRENGQNVADTNTDITLISNGQKQVAAWNFFVPVHCNGTCSTYQLMWSATGSHSNLWYEAPQSNPARPAIPSVIMTVNQVK